MPVYRAAAGIKGWSPVLSPAHHGIQLCQKASQTIFIHLHVSPQANWGSPRAYATHSDGIWPRGKKGQGSFLKERIRSGMHGESCAVKPPFCHRLFSKAIQRLPLITCIGPVWTPLQKRLLHNLPSSICHFSNASGRWEVAEGGVRLTQV